MGNKVVLMDDKERHTHTHTHSLFFPHCDFVIPAQAGIPSLTTKFSRSI